MYLDEFKKYRSSALNKLTNNQKIKDLITDVKDSQISSDELINKHIFPYEYLPGVTEEAKTCITMLFSVPETYGRSLKRAKLIFYVFTHESLMWAVGDDGVSYLRYDLICEEIDKMFNGSDDFGLKLQLQSRYDGYIPVDRFHGVQLIYETNEFNYKV